MPRLDRRPEGPPGRRPLAAALHPRQPGGKWSRINRDQAAALIEARPIGQAGLREVDQARADGRWAAAYESQSTAAVPEDLALALAGNDAAAAFFERLDRANRYAILYRIANAKRPETRARRIATFVAMLSEGKKSIPDRRLGPVVRELG